MTAAITKRYATITKHLQSLPLLFSIISIRIEHDKTQNKVIDFLASQPCFILLKLSFMGSTSITQTNIQLSCIYYNKMTQMKSLKWALAISQLVRIQQVTGSTWAGSLPKLDPYLPAKTWSKSNWVGKNFDNFTETGCANPLDRHWWCRTHSDDHWSTNRTIPPLFSINASSRHLRPSWMVMGIIFTTGSGFSSR